MYDTTLDINQYINAGTECSSQGEQTGNLDRYVLMSEISNQQ